MSAAARISGVNGSALSLADVSAADAGSYTVVVGSAQGNVSSAAAVKGKRVLSLLTLLGCAD